MLYHYSEPEAATEESCQSLDVSEGRPSLRIENCARNLAAVCYRAANLTFPPLTQFVRISAEQDGVMFERSAPVQGWKVDYKVDVWPSNSLRRLVTNNQGSSIQDGNS